MNLNLKIILAVIAGTSGLLSNFACGQTGVFGRIELNSRFPTIAFQRPDDNSPFNIRRIGDGLAVFTPMDSYSTFWIDERSPTSAMMLRETGIGIGTYHPQSAMHIYSNDNSGYDESRMILENDHDETAIRTMMELVNNGGSKLVYENTGSGEAWSINTNAADNFCISRAGTGGAELMIRKNGAVAMGPGTQANFLLAPNGNLTIQGTLSQQSDRNTKRNIRQIDAREVLEKISKLPITSWQYKDDDPSIRHIGPMAQDFRAAFGLGQDEKTIATVDASGVALAAIQALNEQLRAETQEREDRIRELESELAEIKAILVENR